MARNSANTKAATRRFRSISRRTSISTAKMFWPSMSIRRSAPIFRRSATRSTTSPSAAIYREVALRIVPGTFIENIFAKPKDVMSGKPSLDVDCLIQHLEASREPLTLEVELRDGDRVVGQRVRRSWPPRKPLEPSRWCTPCISNNLGADPAVGPRKPKSLHRSRAPC